MSREDPIVRLPPVRLPDVRPVDTPLPSHDLSSGVKIHHVSLDAPIERKDYLASWQWDMLVSVAAAPDGDTMGSVPKLVEAMAEVGLLDIARDGVQFKVTITDSGRDALHRGWYLTT